jgi:hypothetical protein
MRKAAVALGTLGIGAGILYAFGRARQKNTGEALAMDEGVEKVGERGVENQTPNLVTSAVQILEKIKVEAFDSSDEKLALSLGRSVDEIQAWRRGEQIIDSDLLMKARALALEYGLNIEEHSTES